VAKAAEGTYSLESYSFQTANHRLSFGVAISSSQEQTHMSAKKVPKKTPMKAASKTPCKKLKAKQTEQANQEQAAKNLEVFKSYCKQGEPSDQ
jgi:hypothetical protein